MALTLAEAMKEIEELGQEIAVWKEVLSFLQGFVKQEEQDAVSRVITTEAWGSKGTPPMSIVVPEGVIKGVVARVFMVELEPRLTRLEVLQNRSVQEEETDGAGSPEGQPSEETVHGDEQRKPEGNGSGPAKRGRAKLRVTPENPGARKTGRRLVPKPAGAG